MFDARPEDIMPPSMDAAPPDERPSSLAWASFEHFVYPSTFAPDSARAAPTTITRYEFFSDRYVIRTRNLQDWNLTRYRCANRSVKDS